MLGFEEAIGTADDSLRLSILKLLTDLAALRADFFISSTPIETGGIQHVIRPAISTFSNHIVISYDLERVHADIGENIAKFVLPNQAQSLLSVVAGQALGLSFFFTGVQPLGDYIMSSASFSGMPWLKHSEDYAEDYGDSLLDSSDRDNDQWAGRVR